MLTQATQPMKKQTGTIKKGNLQKKPNGKDDSKKQKKSQQGSSSTGGKLTSEALASHDTSADTGALSLDDKLKLMKDKGFDAVSLSGGDFTKLNLRFTQTALQKLDPKIQQAWKEASVAGEGKVHKQHEILQIFAEDPKCGNHFLTRMQAVEESRKVSVETEWASRKKLLLEIDESEAEEMIEDGTLLVRKNPINHRRLQYKRITTKECDETTKSRKTSGHSSVEVNAEKMTGIMNKLSQMDMKRVRGCADSSEEEGIVKNAKPRKEPKKLDDPKEPKEKKAKLDQKTIESLEETDEDAILELTQKLSASMNTVSLTIKNIKIQFEGTMYATPAKVKSLKTIIEQCDAAKKKVDHAVVVNKVTLKLLRTSWETFCQTKIELQKLEKIAQMEDDVASTKAWSKSGKQ